MCAYVCAEKGRKRALRSLTVGQSFGELALQVAGGKRAATVNTSEDCELLALNGFEYRTVLAQHHREDLDRRVCADPPCPAILVFRAPALVAGRPIVFKLSEECCTSKKPSKRCATEF